MYITQNNKFGPEAPFSHAGSQFVLYLRFKSIGSYKCIRRTDALFVFYGLEGRNLLSFQAYYLMLGQNLYAYRASIRSLPSELNHQTRG